ncbi:MAG: hypothetical protein OJF50_003936 [Nitrospira sp.]|nr:hypothetical protein [Nitrospira sp.]
MGLLLKYRQRNPSEFTPFSWEITLARPLLSVLPNEFSIEYGL